MRDVHGIEHGVDVNAATIRGQRGQVEAWEVASIKLVEEVCNFLREVAQFTELAEPHLISAHHLLPPQRPPTNIVLPPTSKMVGDLTPALRSGPNIAADAEAAALIRGSGPDDYDILLPIFTYYCACGNCNNNVIMM